MYMCNIKFRVCATGCSQIFGKQAFITSGLFTECQLFAYFLSYKRARLYIKYNRICKICIYCILTKICQINIFASNAKVKIYVKRSTSIV